MGGFITLVMGNAPAQKSVAGDLLDLAHTFSFDFIFNRMVAKVMQAKNLQTSGVSSRRCGPLYEMLAKP